MTMVKKEVSTENVITEKASTISVDWVILIETCTNTANLGSEHLRISCSGILSLPVWTTVWVGRILVVICVVGVVKIGSSSVDEIKDFENFAGNIANFSSL